MKNFAIKTCSVILLLIALNFSVYTQTQNSPTVSREETVAYLINQNKAANELIAAQKNRITDLEAEVADERENSASLGKSYEAAKSEISSLKSANEALSRAVSINEQTIELLKDENAKQKDKAKRANRDKWKAIIVAAGVIALKFAL